MESEKSRFIVREFARSNANLLKLGIPFTIAGAALIAPCLSPGALPGLASALAWGIILGTIGIVFIVRRLLRGSPESALKAQLPAAADVEEVIAAVDSGLADEVSVRYKNFVMAAGWIVLRRTFSTNLFRAEDLMWHYRSETQHYVNGIKGGREIAIQFHLRSGGFLKLRLKNATAAMQMSEALDARAPWAVSGYVMGLEDAWKADRAGWIANVDAKRQKPRASAASKTAVKPLENAPADTVRKPRAALVFGLGLGAMLIPLPIGIAAVVLGIQDRMEQSKGRMEPSGWTTAGIMLGILGTILQGLVFAMMTLRPPR